MSKKKSYVSQDQSPNTFGRTVYILISGQPYSSVWEKQRLYFHVGNSFDSQVTFQKLTTNNKEKSNIKREFP